MTRVSHKLYWLLSLACVAATGCEFSTPEFHMNMVDAVSNETDSEYQQEIANVLGAMFGTPDDPFVLPETGLDLAKLQIAAGPAWSDSAGSNHGLYRRHCVHCHGVTGGGDGPTARFLNPYPRDYRQAIYKFKSTYNPARPTDEDLHRVLVNGVPGTAMPSFSLLPNSEIEALVEYVKYLSMRGQMETELIRYVYSELGETEQLDEAGEPILEDGEPKMVRIPLDPAKDADQRSAITDMLAEIADGWATANEQIIVPDPVQTPGKDRSDEEVAASIAKGRELFYGIRANCIKCHGPTALGDGEQNDQDNWSKAHKAFLTAMDAQSDAALKAEMQQVAATLLPVRNAIPRNLRKGIYRGGNRRIDIFWKMYAGIAGTPMPGLGAASPGATGTLTEEEMWQLVDYVLSLPYEPPSQPLRALPLNEDETL